MKSDIIDCHGGVDQRSILKKPLSLCRPRYCLYEDRASFYASGTPFLVHIDRALLENRLVALLRRIGSHATSIDSREKEKDHTLGGTTMGGTAPAATPIGVNVFLIVISTSALLLRAISRRLSKSGFWWDDWLAFAAWVISPTLYLICLAEADKKVGMLIIMVAVLNKLLCAFNCRYNSPTSNAPD